MCKKDFMFHNSETYLLFDLTTIDEVGNNEVVNIAICQDCYKKLLIKKKYIEGLMDEIITYRVTT
jgi:hypothetical protein